MTSFVTAFFDSGFDGYVEKYHRYKRGYACAATSLQIESRIRNGFSAVGLYFSLNQVHDQDRTRDNSFLKQAVKRLTLTETTTISGALHRTAIRKAFSIAAKPPSLSSSVSSLGQSPVTMPAPFWFDQMSQNKREDNEEDYDERVELARAKPEQHFRWCRKELQELIHCTPGKCNAILPPHRNKTGRVASEDRYKDNVKTEKWRYEHFANYEKDPKTLLKEATYRSMRYRQTEAKPDSKKLVERKKGWKVSLPKVLKEQLSETVSATLEEHVSDASEASFEHAASDNVQEGSDTTGADENGADLQADTGG
ncbi:hypothetical protein AC579_2326 [Pseudocercospora musae]|uniref:Uncharacterized protein n=1 Tax=Pseudocercospora musae TaxID=113226 RepID=A0A139H3R2_9PEZI|nr:hypothetical protein AC579_2326 [Pseudocercospora musae]